MTKVEAHSCLLNMHVTFDLAEIEELMPQQARKQLEAELEKSCCSLGGVRCLYTAVLVSPASPASPVHSRSSPVQSPGFTETHWSSTVSVGDCMKKVQMML